MASRDLNDLAEPVKAAALAFVHECQRRGFDVLIYCTLRSLQEQDAMYAQGRTAPGRVVTNARAGQSLHNPDASGKAWAFDAVPVRHGKALFDDGGAINQMGAAGEAVGLEWAGRWNGKMRERVHFQLKRNGG